MTSCKVKLVDHKKINSVTFNLYEIFRVVRTIETASRIVVVMERYCLMGRKSFGLTR